MNWIEEASMIYFDNAATTRALPAVAEKMSTMLCEQYGNPASVSAMGLAAEKETEMRRKSSREGFAANMTRFSLPAAGTEGRQLGDLRHGRGL